VLDILPLGLVLTGLLSLERPSRGDEPRPEKKPGFIGIQMDAIALEGSQIVAVA
jgi:hypothetical protein